MSDERQGTNGIQYPISPSQKKLLEKVPQHKKPLSCKKTKKELLDHGATTPLPGYMKTRYTSKKQLQTM